MQPFIDHCDTLTVRSAVELSIIRMCVRSSAAPSSHGVGEHAARTLVLWDTRLQTMIPRPLVRALARAR